MTTEELIAAHRTEPRREALRKNEKNKECADIPHVKMNELNPEYQGRARLGEIDLGLTREQAMQEAEHCLDCSNPICMQGCPVSINISTSIKNIEHGGFLETTKILKETNALPAVCGRICPQEKQCEDKCIRLKMGKEAVAIGYLERFATDYEHEGGNISVPEIAEKNDIKIAVVGSGPAGLSFVGDMAKRGYDVTVLEALHGIGGVLKYDIPGFYLPNKIVDVEVDGLRKMGVRFEKDCIVGKTISYDDLHMDDFKGVFVASGVGLPNFMNIPGESFMDVTSSSEYLAHINLMNTADPESGTLMLQGRKVAVIKGGSTAMDSVRTARRLSAKRAMAVYRHSEEEMPARLEEVKHAKERGVEFMALHNPIGYIDNERSRVKQMRLQKMELGKADASGRRRPVPVEEAIETIGVDGVVASVGISPNPLIPRAFEGLGVGKKGTIVVEEDSVRSALGDVYAGGDIVRSGAIMILVTGDGRKAAVAVDADLRG